MTKNRLITFAVSLASLCWGRTALIPLQQQQVHGLHSVEQTGADWRCAAPYLRGRRPAVKLASEEILARVVRRQQVRSPGKGNFTGTVDLDVVVGVSGKVWCVRAVTGNALAIGPAIGSVSNWKFRPFRDQNGRRRVFYGTVTIPLSP